MVDVLGEDLSSPAIGLVRHLANLEQVGSCGDHAEHRQSGPRVPAAADLPIVPKLRERLPGDEFGNDQAVPAMPGVRYRGDGPPMMEVTPVQRRDQQAGVGYRVQRA